MQGFPPAGGVLPKEKKAEIALIVLGIAKKKLRGLGPICMCIYRNVHNMWGVRARSLRVGGGGRAAAGGPGFRPDFLRIPYGFLMKTGRHYLHFAVELSPLKRADNPPEWRGSAGADPPRRHNKYCQN